MLIVWQLTLSVDSSDDVNGVKLASRISRVNKQNFQIYVTYSSLNLNLLGKMWFEKNVSPYYLIQCLVHHHHHHLLSHSTWTMESNFYWAKYAPLIYRYVDLLSILLLCLNKFRRSMNLRRQTSHSNGFSPDTYMRAHITWVGFGAAVYPRADADFTGLSFRLRLLTPIIISSNEDE